MIKLEEAILLLNGELAKNNYIVVGDYKLTKDSLLKLYYTKKPFLVKNVNGENFASLRAFVESNKKVTLQVIC